MKCIDCGAESGDSARCKSCWDDRRGGVMDAKNEFPDRYTIGSRTEFGLSGREKTVWESTKVEYLSLEEHNNILAKERAKAERERTLGSIVAPAVAKENERLRAKCERYRDALESIASQSNEAHGTMAYWLAVDHHECAEVLMNDTNEAREALKEG